MLEKLVEWFRGKDRPSLSDLRVEHGDLRKAIREERVQTSASARRLYSLIDEMLAENDRLRTNRRN